MCFHGWTATIGVLDVPQNHNLVTHSPAPADKLSLHVPITRRCQWTLPQIAGKPLPPVIKLPTKTLI